MRKLTQKLFHTGGLVKLPSALKDGEIPTFLSSQREWVKLQDGRVVEIHGGIFDARYYTKNDTDV